MGEAIGQVLPAAVGVAISPLPIVAVVLMLVTPRGRGNGVAFVAGWLIGLAVVGTVVLLAADGVDAASDDGPAGWVAVLKLALGATLVLVAVKQWRSRAHADDASTTPGWMRALDAFTPVKAAGIGALLAGVNPKNTLLSVSAAASIAGTGVDGGQAAIAYAVFAVIATVGVAAPVALAIVLGDRSRPVLDELKAWLSANNTAIMAVLLLVLGVKLVGDGISGL